MKAFVHKIDLWQDKNVLKVVLTIVLENYPEALLYESYSVKTFVIRV